MTIKINEKEYELKYTLRALFIFEQIKGKQFSIDTLTDEYLFFYCLILANNKDVEMSFDAFIDELDKTPGLILEYKNFMEQEMRKQNIFKPEETDDKKKV